MFKRLHFYLVLFLFFFIFSSIQVMATPLFISNDTVYIYENYNDDVYASGGSIIINADIDGDLICAGGNITINGNINGSLMCAGGNINIMGDIVGNVRIVGGTINIMGNIERNILFTGGNISISDNTHIKGSVYGMAGFLNLNGIVDGEISLNMGTGTINAILNNDLYIESESIKIKDSTYIKGDFEYKSAENIEFDPNIIEGKYTFTQIEFKPQLPKKEISLLTFLISIASILFFFAISNFLLGSLFIFTTPNFIKNISKNIYEKSFYSFLMGIICFICLMIIPIILFFIGITYKIGLIGILSFIILFILITPLNIFSICYMFIKNKKNLKTTTFLLFYLISTIIYYIISLIPIAGIIFIIILSLLSIGGLYYAKIDVYNKMRDKKLI